MGRHPVADALAYDPTRAKRLLLPESGDEALEAAARKAGVTVQRVSLDELDDKSWGVPHQGAVLECAPFVFAELEDGLETESLMLALDGVEDPRNLGAATRAALALGAERVIIPARRAAQPTASAHKAAAGALSRLPVVQVENIRRALEQAKEAGWWIVGAEADGTATPWQVDWTDKMVLVVGGEDRGLRRLVREACDHVVSIPMAATGVTLNAADAATVLLYEALRQRQLAKAASEAERDEEQA